MAYGRARSGNVLVLQPPLGAPEGAVGPSAPGRVPTGREPLRSVWRPRRCPSGRVPRGVALRRSPARAEAGADDRTVPRLPRVQAHGARKRHRQRRARPPARGPHQPLYSKPSRRVPGASVCRLAATQPAPPGSWTSRHSPPTASTPWRRSHQRDDRRGPRRGRAHRPPTRSRSRPPASCATSARSTDPTVATAPHRYSQTDEACRRVSGRQCCPAGLRALS
jgi:hypothetical protein